MGEGLFEDSTPLTLSSIILVNYCKSINFRVISQKIIVKFLITKSNLSLLSQHWICHTAFVSKDS